MTDTSNTLDVGAAIKTSVDNLYQKILVDEVTVTRPAADTYLGAVIQDLEDPTLATPGVLAAESVKFEQTAIGLLPQVAGTAAKDTAQSVKALLDLIADNVTGNVPGTTSSTAAIAVAATTAG